MPTSHTVRAYLPHWPTVLKAGMIAGAFLIGSELSFEFYSMPAVFPFHSGIALASLVLAGIEFWPAIFVAALFSYAWHDSPLLLLITLTLGNTIQAVTGAYILRYVGFKPSLRRMRDIFSLTIVALFASTIVPAVGFIGYELHTFLGGNPLPIPLGAWWVGHIFSLLIVAPFLIRWLAHPIFRRTGWKVIEMGVALPTLLAVYGFLFFTTIEQINGIPLVYLIFPPLFWIALRLGSRFMTLGLFLSSLLALVGTGLGHASVSSLSSGQELFLTQIFLEVIAVIFLIVTAVEEERRTATTRLQGHVDQLQDALTKIRSEDTAKTTFVATLAHELRNPLAPLLSTIELLTLRGPHAKDFPAMLSTMRDRVKTMARLLDDLLDISRISHQKLQLQKTTVDIVKVVKSSVESMLGFMQKSNLSFNVTLPHNETLLLEADPIRLEQIIVNLLHNAAKYTPEGKINLTLERDKNMVVIRVRDTGIGIPPHMLQKIFEPFLQLNVKEGSGLGIGLSLTKRLVELHGGTIEAKSEGEGKGSEFIVQLPLLTVSPIQPVLPKERLLRTEAAPKGLRILLVDDNRAATETLGKLLEFKGYTVRFAYDGAGTLREADAFDPHIVMLDIGLPDMSGYDVARKLRDEHDDIALVAITGYGQEEDKTLSKNAGFDYHLTKPVGIADLEKTLSQLSKSHPALTAI